MVQVCSIVRQLYLFTPLFQHVLLPEPTHGYFRRGCAQPLAEMLEIQTVTGNFFFSLAATSYLVSVRTGDVRGAGTDANVFVQIFGAKGDTGKLQLRSAENTKNKFERSRTDQFVLEAVDIGKVGNDKGRNKQAQPLC